MLDSKSTTPLAPIAAYCEQCRYAHRPCCCPAWQAYCAVCAPLAVAGLTAIVRELRDEIVGMS